MQLPRIRFPRRPGRTYAYNALPDNLGAAGDPAVKSLPDQRKLGGSSRAGSRRIVDGPGVSPGRPEFGGQHSADDLNLGLAPARITRATPALDRGKISAEAGGGMDGWPYDGNALYVPRLPIPRKPVTISPFQRTIDPGVTIPSIPIGGTLE